VAAQKWDSIMRFYLHARAFIGTAMFAASTLVAAYGLQVFRLLKVYRIEGPTGLISKRRGRRRGAQETGH
jgi:hypothetical protein